jgi:hypothetical protein
VDEFLTHRGYRNNKGSFGVEAGVAVSAALPRLAIRLPKDIRYDIDIFDVGRIDGGAGKDFWGASKVPSLAFPFSTALSMRT